MTGAEFDELAENIRQHGQHEPGTVLDGKILDGRNRYVACERAGIPFRARQYAGPDPLAFVISANIHRRHMTIEQRQQFREAIIKRHPEMSDRFLARLVQVDHKTIAADRARLESTGEHSPVEKRTGNDGKSRKHPACKPSGEPVCDTKPVTYVPPKPPIPQPGSTERLEDIPARPETGVVLRLSMPSGADARAKCLFDKYGMTEFMDLLAAMERLIKSMTSDNDDSTSDANTMH